MSDKDGTRRRFAVFSTGHAGSTWLSHLFEKVAGVPTFHESLMKLVSTDSIEAVARTTVAPRRTSEARPDPLSAYLAWLDHRRRRALALACDHPILALVPRYQRKSGRTGSALCWTGGSGLFCTVWQGS